MDIRTYERTEEIRRIARQEIEADRRRRHLAIEDDRRRRQLAQQKHEEEVAAQGTGTGTGTETETLGAEGIRAAGVAEVAAAQRAEAAATYGRRLVLKGLTKDEVSLLLAYWNLHTCPSLSEHELTRLLDAIWRARPPLSDDAPLNTGATQ
jgi:hypothetical protein